MFFGYFLNIKKVTPSADFVIGPAKAGAFLFSHTRLPLSPRPLLPFGRISLRPLGGRPLRGHGFAAPHRHFPLPAAAAPTTVSGCCFLTNMNRKHNIQPEIWYNNLKPAACAAARSSCADALSRTGLENIEPCKTAVNAVLSRPLRGAMVYWRQAPRNTARGISYNNKEAAYAAPCMHLCRRAHRYFRAAL